MADLFGTPTPGDEITVTATYLDHADYHSHRIRINGCIAYIPTSQLTTPHPGLTCTEAQDLIDHYRSQP